MTKLAEIRASTLLTQPRTLRGLVLYFLGLGSWGFGGPIALVGYMRRDLVERRRWSSEEEYEQGLAIAQTMPVRSPPSSRCGSAFSSAARPAR